MTQCKNSLSSVISCYAGERNDDSDDNMTRTMMCVLYAWNSTRPKLSARLPGPRQSRRVPVKIKIAATRVKMSVLYVDFK